jgi:hypothetical protein
MRHDWQSIIFAGICIATTALLVRVLWQAASLILAKP